MGPVYLFDLVSRHNQWLSVRQATIAGNVANANTPAFKARDVEAFSAALDAAKLSMASTRPGHLALPDANQPAVEERNEEPWDTSHSGNTVSLEQELIKAGEVNRSYRLNTGVLKAFHRMLLASSKG
jgi:flagellar basal-body rod protein FlgB